MLNYIGIPYKSGGLDREGIDCWGLVRLVYREQLGIELPMYSSQYQGREEMAEEISRQRESWLNVDIPRAFDVVLLRIAGEETHLGLVITPGEFIHSLRGIGVVKEKYNTGTWKHRIVGFFRYKGEAAPIAINGTPHPLKTIRIESVVSSGLSLSEMILQARQQTCTGVSGRGVAWVNGSKVPEEVWESTYPSPGSVVEFRIVPGDGAIGRVVGMFAVMAFAWWAGPAFAGALGLEAGSTAAGIVGGITSAGVMFAGTMLINSIFPVRVPANTNPGVAESHAILTSSQNVINKFGALPIVLGRFTYAPPLAANTYSETTSAYSFLRIALCWGVGPLQVENINLGGVKVTNYEECEIQTLNGNGWPSEAAKKRFNEIYGARDVAQVYVNQELVVDKYTDPYWVEQAITSPIDRMTVTLNFPEGLRAVANSGDHAGETFATNFRAYVQFRELDAETLAPVGDWMTPTGATDESTKIIAAEDIELDSAWFAAPFGYIDKYKIGYRKTIISANTKNGAIISRTSSISETEDSVDIPGVKTGEVTLWVITVRGDSVLNSEDMRGTAVDGCSLSISSMVASVAGGEFNETDEGGIYRVAIGGEGEDWERHKDAFTINVEQKFSNTAPYAVRIKRTTPSGPREYTAPGGTRFTRLATCQWLFVTGYRNAKPIKPPVPMALTAVRIKATDQIDGTADVITGTSTTICLDYDYESDSWVKRATSNPASLYRYIRQHPCNAKACGDSGLDIAQLEEFHDFCRVNKFFYNSVVTEFQSVRELCRDVCAAGRATPCKNGEGKWSVIIDKPRNGYSQLLTPHNSWDFEGVLSLPTLPHAFRCTFYNENASYAQDEIIVYMPGYSASTATLFEKIDFPGVTDPSTIVKHARFHLGQLRLRPEKYTLNMDFEHLRCTRGDLVRCVHDTPMWGVSSGRIKNMLSPTSLELDVEVPMEAGEVYALTIRVSESGELVEKLISPKSSDGYYSTITLQDPISTEEGASGNLVAIGEGADLIVENIEMLDQITARLTLVDYAPEIYSLDDEEIPEHDTNITYPQDIDLVPIAVSPTISKLISDERAMVAPKGINAYRIMVAVEHPQSLPRKVNGYEVQYRLSGSSKWRSIGNNSIDEVSYIEDVTEQSTYEIRARYITKIGATGPWGINSIHTVEGRINPPPNVTQLHVANKHLVWSFNNPPMDLGGFEIRCAFGNVTSWDACSKVRGGRVVDQTFDISDYITNRQRTWMVKAYDTAGNYSKSPAKFVTAQWEYDNSDPPPKNIVFTYDLAVEGWPGDKRNCSISDGKLVSNEVGTFWDSGIFWGNIERLFWEVTYSPMTYIFSWRPSSDLVGANVQDNVVASSSIESIRYSVGSSELFWGYDEDIFWGNDSELFWGEPEWATLPNRLRNIADRLYTFSVNLQGVNSQSEISTCQLVIDVPDRVEDIEFSVSALGSKAPIQKNYNVIKYVRASLIDDGGDAVFCKVINKAIDGPMIACYNILGALTSGAVNAKIIGY